MWTTDIFAERVPTPANPKKQRRSVAEKRGMVEEARAEGSSVAFIASAHG